MHQDPRDEALRIRWLRLMLSITPIRDPWHDLVDQVAALGSGLARAALGSVRTIGWDLGDRGQWWCTVGFMNRDQWERWLSEAHARLGMAHAVLPENTDSAWDVFQAGARACIQGPTRPLGWNYMSERIHPLGHGGACELAVELFTPDLFAISQNSTKEVT